MHISPINGVAAYSEAFDSIALEKNVAPSRTEPSIFRAWTRGSGKLLAVVGAMPSLRSGEAFWSQWPEKKWRTL